MGSNICVALLLGMLSACTLIADFPEASPANQSSSDGDMEADADADTDVDVDTDVDTDADLDQDDGDCWGIACERECPGPTCDEASARCDPSSLAPCYQDWFYCYDDNSQRICEMQSPSTPGSNAWCEEVGHMSVCEYSGNIEYEECHELEATVVCTIGGWNCTLYADSTICRRHGVYPSDEHEEGGIWDCYYEEQHRTCGLRPEENECPPGVIDPDGEYCGDGVDNDCNGTIDETCDGAACNPHDRRYCVMLNYGRWGSQTCNEEGWAWSDCDEVAVPNECVDFSWYSPAAEICCVEQDGPCCQDQWDLDGDGDIYDSLPEECSTI